MIPGEAVLPLLLGGIAAFAIPALWISVWSPRLMHRRHLRDHAKYWEGWRDGRKTGRTDV